MSIAGVGANSFDWNWQELSKNTGQSQQAATSGGTGSTDSSQLNQGAGSNPLLSSLSPVLNLSESQINQDLSGGQSLNQIASNQGVSQSTLVSAIQSSLQSSPFGQSMSSSQLSNMANSIASSTGQLPPPPSQSSSSQSGEGSNGGGIQQSQISEMATNLSNAFVQDLEQLSSSQANDISGISTTTSD